MLTKRSISIGDLITSISLEEAFWNELDRQAGLRGVPWQQYARELVEGLPVQTNRSSVIREKLLLQLKQDILRVRKARMEAWWTIRTPHGTQEIGTRGAILFAGRDPGNDLVVDDERVSRRHLMFGWDGDRWWVVDLGSKNGAIVKGKKVQAAPIEKGRSVLIGGSELTLVG